MTKRTLASDGETRMWPHARYTSSSTEEVLPGIFHTCFTITGYDLCDRIDQYVVVDGEEALFFDLGYWEVCGTRALDEVDSLTSYPLTKISAFISHFHDDHAGNIPYAQAHGFDAIYHGTRASFDKDVLQTFVQATGWSSVPQTRGRAALETPETILAALWDNNVLPTYEGVVVNALDEIHVGNRTFVVVKTPGHSPDHASLWEPERGILFGGDHLLDFGPGIIQFAPREHLIMRYLTSLDELEGWDLQAVLPAHNDPYLGACAVKSLFETTRTFLEKSLDKRLQLVQAHPGASVLEIMCAQKGEDDFFARPLRHRARAVAATYAYLEALCDQGLIKRCINDDGVECFSAL